MAVRIFDRNDKIKGHVLSSGLPPLAFEGTGLVFLQQSYFLQN